MKPHYPLISVALALALGSCASAPGRGSSLELHTEYPVSEAVGDATSALQQEFAPALKDYLEQQQIAGLAIGLVQNGEVIYAQGFGEHRRGGGKAVTTDSVFHTASLSKPMTATAIMKLVEEGKLALDDRIVDHLPYFRLVEEESREITIRQVLTHTSGLPDVPDYEWNQPRYDRGAAERYVRSMAEMNLAYPPGTDRQYSNLAFDLLGDVIAKASGESFEDYASARILEPLGMSQSSFQPDRLSRSLRTQGHTSAFAERIDHQPAKHHPYNRRHAPSSTLNSSVRDQCRWMIANLNQGELDGVRFLEAASYGELWSTEDETPDIGLGWWIGPMADEVCVNHSGADDGFRAFVGMLPAFDLGVIVLSNSDGTNTSAIAGAAVRAALGRPWEMPKPSTYPVAAQVLEDQGVDAALSWYQSQLEEQTDAWRLEYWQLDVLAARLMWRERFDEALQVAQFNAELYPEEAEELNARIEQIQERRGKAAEVEETASRWQASFEHSIEAAASLASIDLMTYAGAIEVRPSSGDEVKLTIRVSCDRWDTKEEQRSTHLADHVGIESKGESITVRSLHDGKGRERDQDWSVTIIASVPESVALKAYSGAGNLTLALPDATFVSMDLESGAGDVEVDVREVRESVRATTGAGAVLATVHQGTPARGYHLKTGAGSVVLRCPEDTVGQFIMESAVGSVSHAECFPFRVDRTVVAASARGSFGGVSAPKSRLVSAAGDVSMLTPRQASAKD